jgi:uncharacterized phage protein (TIGR02216 family)
LIAAGGESGEARAFPWDDVLHVGLSLLRLEPRAFWALTPIEFSAMAGALGHRQGRLSRGGLEALMAVFPDRR